MSDLEMNTWYMQYFILQDAANSTYEGGLSEVGQHQSRGT